MLGSSTQIDDETWDDIETLLIQADVGVETTAKVLEDLRVRVRRENIRSPEQMQRALKACLTDLLQTPPTPTISGGALSIILIVGVNGSAAAHALGKLAHRLNNVNNRRVMIAAGDTFRAAAIDQLQKWGERAQVPVIANKPGSDAAAVVFDAVTAAKARGKDILLVDTAGRLHTNYNLMEELAKIKAVAAKVVPDAPHEVWLVLDGTTGQNALQQAQKFREMVDVTGLIVTKLDGTAKGGMIFAIQDSVKLPVHYIGLGEAIHDLVPFRPDFFVDSLFDEEDTV